MTQTNKQDNQTYNIFFKSSIETNHRTVEMKTNWLEIILFLSVCVVKWQHDDRDLIDAESQRITSREGMYEERYREGQTRAWIHVA